MRSLSLYIVLSVLVILSIVLGACRSSRSAVSLQEERDTHKSTSIRELQDTLIVRDSIFFEAAGCTIRVREVRDRYHIICDLRTDTLCDTLYRTIQKTEVRERVVKKRGFVYNIGIAAIAIVAIFMFYNIFLHFSRK